MRLALLVAIGLAGALLSLGPKPASLGVYDACVALLPGFKTMREPLRAALMTHLSVNGSVNGRTGYYSPPLRDRMVTLVSTVTRPDALAELRRVAGLRWVLVRCPDVRGLARLVMAPLCGPTPSSVGTVHEFGSVRLYDLGSSGALPRPWPSRWPAAPDCVSEPRTRSTL